MLRGTLKIVDPGISDSLEWGAGVVGVSSENLVHVMDTVFQTQVALIPSLVLI